MNATPRFADVAAQLVENGYQPLPLHFGQKRPCAGDGWQHYRFREADVERFANAGCGILCGKVIGLDIDVRDPKIAAALDALAEQTFGPAPRRIGQAPKVLRVLQASAPFAKVTSRSYRLHGDAPDAPTHRVEILATGQQFVAFNLHPATGQPYTWNGVGDPRTVPIGCLPIVTEQSAREFIAAAEKILAQYGHAVSGDEDHHGADHGGDHVGAGGRNDFLSREAYRLRKLGWSTGQILTVLRAMNDAHCKPPLPDAEVQQIVGGKAGVTSDADADPWTDEPLNLFAKFAARPLVAADLPPEIAEYPALYAKATGFDPTLTLSSALAIMAAAIPDQIQVCANPATRYFASARLWVMNLGRPGAAKSPGQKAMREPLDRLNVDLYESWKAEAAACEKEKTPPPPQPTAVVNNVTIEAMSEALVNNERGVLYANDEAMSWLGSMDQYRSGGMDGDRAEWLRMFDGGHHVVHRIKRGTVFVKNWGASVLTATTPAALEKVARHLPEDGLLQRVMVFHVRSRQVASADSGRGEIEPARDRYTATIHRLWGLMPKEHNGVVMLSPEARSLFRTWEADLIKRQEAFGALSTALESHLAKYTTFALRLALTFHCAQVVNMADPRARDPAAYPITAATFGQVFRFLNRVQRHAFALYLGLGKSASYELARDIARTILARHTTSGTVQRRELMQTTMAFRKADRGAQDDALQLLVDAGWLRPDSSGYPKAGARYTVNPHLASRFATLAAEERERRAIAREAIAESAQDRRAERGTDESD